MDCNSNVWRAQSCLLTDSSPKWTASRIRMMRSCISWLSVSPERKEPEPHSPSQGRAAAHVPQSRQPNLGCLHVSREWKPRSLRQCRDSRIIPQSCQPNVGCLHTSREPRHPGERNPTAPVEAAERQRTGGDGDQVEGGRKTASWVSLARPPAAVASDSRTPAIMEGESKNSA